MISMGVDTSTPAGSVAILSDERLLGEFNLASGAHHQERLLRSLDLLLDLAGLDISRVDLFAVALGPGTFTGLRVGIATVKGLALARGVPAFGFSTLKALGDNHAHRGLPVAAMIDAGRGEVYAALYESDPGGVKEVLPERGEAPERFLSTLPDQPLLFCGSGVRTYSDLILRQRRGNDQLLEGPSFLGQILGRLGLRKFKEGCPWSLASLKPNYLRLPDAEVRWRP